MMRQERDKNREGQMMQRTSNGVKEKQRERETERERERIALITPLLNY